MLSILRMPRKRYAGQDKWPKAKDDAIRTWKAAGWSSSQMATRLGVTRNAVIGRMNRLMKRNDWHQHTPSAPYVAPEPVKAAVRPPQPQETVSKPFGICRHGTCTKTRARPYPYCREHLGSAA
jgi:hypothetical protein